jgi:hypothetical protein
MARASLKIIGGRLQRPRAKHQTASTWPQITRARPKPARADKFPAVHKKVLTFRRIFAKPSQQQQERDSL